MDTRGLEEVGLHDLQCHFHDLEATAVAHVLFNTALYIFENGPVIESGQTVAGIEPGSKWRCQFENSLLDPKREVLDVNPGKPYAAGNRISPYQCRSNLLDQLFVDRFGSTPKVNLTLYLQPRFCWDFVGVISCAFVDRSSRNVTGDPEITRNKHEQETDSNPNLDTVFKPKRRMKDLLLSPRASCFADMNWSRHINELAKSLELLTDRSCT